MAAVLAGFACPVLVMDSWRASPGCVHASMSL
jgi:hypothetical protein